MYCKHMNIRCDDVSCDLCKKIQEQSYEKGRADAIKEFAEWLEKMNYLNNVEVDYDWEERPYESVYMLSKNEVINQYKEYKEQNNDSERND